MKRIVIVTICLMTIFFVGAPLGADTSLPAMYHLLLKHNSVTPAGTVVSVGRIWLDRNLGASRVAVSSTDAAAYGDLYQWGRLTDGHEKRTSSTTTTLSTTDVPGNSDFILSPGDWRNPQNGSLWQGVSGTNNPCPDGFRLPTISEWQTEQESWDTKDAAGAYASPLKLVLGGGRSKEFGDINQAGSIGLYWASTTTMPGTSYSRYIDFDDSGMLDFVSLANRAEGMSVRCIKD